MSEGKDSGVEWASGGPGSRVAAGRRRRRAGPITAATIVFVALLVPLAGVLTLAADDEVELLDTLAIPKYANQLTGPPPVFEATVVKRGGKVIAHEYEVDMTAFSEQILPPGFPQTPVWGYGGQARDALTGASLGYVRNSPGPTFEAVRGIPINVKWINKIDAPHMFAVDPTIHWANPNDMEMPMYPFEPFPPGYPNAQAPVPLVTHLHGGEVQSTSDGGPDSWFTWDGTHGPDYSTYRKTAKNAAIYRYPNAQLPTTLWYHDHALGITRINVMSGLAGFYLLRDPDDPVEAVLPSREYEMPLVIQDRTFKVNGEFYFPAESDNPYDHPYWLPEFFGDTIMVNGKVWPNMDVKQGQYRLRLLDGSNARFYTLSFQVKLGPAVMRLPFLQIGSDGGYLKTPVTLERLTIAPGERADILVDFTGLPAGTKILLVNSAKTPFPNGTPSDPRTNGQVMQFTVNDEPGFAPTAPLPGILNPTLSAAWPTLDPPTKKRILTLFEVMGPGGPLEVLLDGKRWSADVSEYPTLGTTEDWIIVNPTADTHPIHLHLVQFQLVSRQAMDTRRYANAWMMLNGMPPVPNDWTVETVPIEGYLRGPVMYAPPSEQGWKDTVQMNPGEVTIIRVRFANQEGGPYPFDATSGPGYVWHCHILDHEDNEMMRPYYVVAP